MKRHSILVVLALASIGGFAHADPKPGTAAADPGVGEARDRFLRGVDLYREGSFDAALAEFNKAYQLAPNFRVLYNMAQVQTERHDYVAALKLLAQYLKDGGTEIPADRQAQVQQELTSLKARVTELTVTSNVADAELDIDGAAVGNLPLDKPVLVGAGVRQIQLRKPGYVGNEKTLTVAGGDTMTVDLQMQDEPTPAPSPSGSAAEQLAVKPLPSDVDAGASRGPDNHLGFWISAASTVALAGGAVAFGLVTHSANHSLDNALNQFPADPNRLAGLRSDVKRDAALTDGFTAAAIVAAGFTVYFAISGTHSSKTQEPAQVGLRVAPTALDVVGTF